MRAISKNHIVITKPEISNRELAQKLGQLAKEERRITHEI